MSESVRISKTVAFLLRHRPDVGGLAPDSEGWVEVHALSVSVSQLMGIEISVDQVVVACNEGPTRRFEFNAERIRPLLRAEPAVDADTRRVQPPDILYHATTEADIARFLTQGELSVGPDRHVFLSSDEAQAWRVAHRMQGLPRVLYVDAARARRHNVKFFRNRRSGLYLSTPIPVGDILNLQPHFAEQVSAGGVLASFESGEPRVALIRVHRRSGSTWEIAKGKLEPGEPPEVAAVRELREEMGVEVGVRITRPLGIVRYGFLAPGGLPRLKTVHLYLMEPDAPITAFTPAAGEGIADVQWFSLDDACRAVTHTSLVPMMRRACHLLTQAPLAATV